MCEGEKRKLVIPSDLGYGERGAPPKIPGKEEFVYKRHSWIYFEILTEVRWMICTLSKVKVLPFS